MTSENVLREIEALGSEIKSSLPDANVQFTAFPSGSGMLDVRRGGRLFVLDYSPARRFGVDEVRSEEGFQTGYQYAYDELGPAADRLRELVSSTSQACLSARDGCPTRSGQVHDA